MTLWKRFRSLVLVLEPTWWVALVVVALALTMVVPQSGEVLAAAANPADVAYAGVLALIMVYLGTAVVAVTAWYLARLLLNIDYRGPAGPRVPRDPATDASRRDVKARLVWARALGLVPWLAVAVGFWKAGEPLHIALSLAGGGAFLAFAAGRRRLLEKDPELVSGMARLPASSKLAASAVLLANGLVFGVLMISPVAGARIIGSAGILLLAFAGWIVIGGILVHAGYASCAAYGWPRLLPIYGFLGITVAAGLLLDDNHPIRNVDPGETVSRAEPVEIDDHFREWLGKRATSDAPVPVILVAAEGGGIRAAYWTASVLGRLSEKVPGFACHVYAVSGVSGGTVGAAVWIARLAESLGPESLDCGRFPEQLDLVDPAQRVLARDLLSPILGALLTREIVAHYLPWQLWEDRAAVFERGLEAAWEDRGSTRKGLSLSRGFRSLWGVEKVSVYLPSLFANAASQETGGPTTIANVEWNPADDTPGRSSLATYPLRPRLGEIPVSTAAHASARFPFVSPAGSIRCPEDPSDGDRSCRGRAGEVWDRVADGGYFETSGGYIALAIKERLATVCGADGMPECRFIHVSITNDPKHGAIREEACKAGDEEACAPAPRSRFLLNPVETFLKTRGAWRDLAEERFLADVPPEASIGFRVRPDAEFANPALGWLLDERSRNNLRRQAEAQPLDRISAALHTDGGRP